MITSEMKNMMKQDQVLKDIAEIKERIKQILYEIADLKEKINDRD